MKNEESGGLRERQDDEEESTLILIPIIYCRLPLTPFILHMRGTWREIDGFDINMV